MVVLDIELGRERHAGVALINAINKQRQGTPVLVDGIETMLVGRVSMDMLTVDLTDVPGAQVGSKVTLWGAGLPIDTVASSAGTIGYELMCAVAPRVRVVEANLDPHG